MNWDVLINMKINKYLNATLNTTLKYDNDVKTINDEGEKRGAKVPVSYTHLTLPTTERV